jgi:hypothetical protein
LLRRNAKIWLGFIDAIDISFQQSAEVTRYTAKEPSRQRLSDLALVASVALFEIARPDKILDAGEPIEFKNRAAEAVLGPLAAPGLPLRWSVSHAA